MRSDEEAVEEAVEEADDWSETMPSSASVSDWLDSARSASASVMRLTVVGSATATLLNIEQAHFSRIPSVCPSARP